MSQPQQPLRSILKKSSGAQYHTKPQPHQIEPQPARKHCIGSRNYIFSGVKPGWLDAVWERLINSDIPVQERAQKSVAFEDRADTPMDTEERVTEGFYREKSSPAPGETSKVSYPDLPGEKKAMDATEAGMGEISYPKLPKE